MRETPPLRSHGVEAAAPGAARGVSQDGRRLPQPLQPHAAAEPHGFLNKTRFISKAFLAIKYLESQQTPEKAEKMNFLKAHHSSTTGGLEDATRWRLSLKPGPAEENPE